MSRQNRQNQCQSCGGFGHNRATCQRRSTPIVVAPPKAPTAYDRALPLIGTMPDAEVAEIVGSHVYTITAWRRKLGLPRPPRRNRVQDNPDVRYPGIKARLGVDTDTRIASHYGLSRERVRQFRARYGIQAVGNIERPPLPPDAIAMLGRIPDVHIGEFFDTPTRVVRHARRDANLPAASSEHYYESVINLAKDKVGKVSDRVLSKELNVAVAQIVAYRTRHGIPPARLSPRCADFQPVNRDEVYRLYHEGKTDVEIAKALGAARGTIIQIRSAELKLLRRPAPTRLTPEMKETIQRMYAAGKAMWRISIELHIAHTTVRKFILKGTP